VLIGESMREPTSTPRRWQIQFPDFPAGDIPPVPPGFSDTSWVNEPCPSFTHEGLGLALFTDWSDPSEREWPESDRFTLHRLDWSAATTVKGHPIPAGWGFAAQTSVIAAGEDFPAILAAIAVFAFADALAVCAAMAHLAEWEADDLKAPRPCPDLLGWIADCRAGLAERPPRLAEIEAFANHFADLETEAAAIA
jgi:hypothetical protein